MRLPTEHDVHSIIEIGTWFEELNWTEVKNGIFRCHAESTWSAGIQLDLSGTYNAKAKSYKWMLQFNKRRILAIDYAAAKHHNPDCEDVYDPHFHEWRDKEGEACWAIPVSFDNCEDVTAGLYWFLRHCNISVSRLPGDPPVFASQRRLIR